MADKQNFVFEHVPRFFRCDLADDTLRLQKLLDSGEYIEIYDTIHAQLRELIKGRNADNELEEEDYSDKIRTHLNGNDPDHYGVWVYYPWSGRLVHLLDSEEFAEVRMQRNLYKITADEQKLLASKSVGVVGLSVGQSVALTIAMERGCGELRLADFDWLELSNMNRIRTGVHNLGISKVVIAAREIAEIDPFIKVTCFPNGINEDNIDRFLLDGGKLDILVEECDSLDIKILVRLKAKALGIPVLMETNDRCMLDIERFDCEPDRPILHGLIGNLQSSGLKNLTNEEKVSILFQMLGVHQISVRGIGSMIEVGYSITSWSQLASSVTLGGAVVADISRRILTGENIASGRVYVDLDEIVKCAPEESRDHHVHENPHPTLTDVEIKNMAAEASACIQIPQESLSLSKKQVHALVWAGMEAPSTGNNQPWKWFYNDRVLLLFHDKSRSFNFANFENSSAYLTLGAAIENIKIKADSVSLTTHCQLFPLPENDTLIASFTFAGHDIESELSRKNSILADHISSRCTNRNVSAYQAVQPEMLETLGNEAKRIASADVKWISNQALIGKAAKIIAKSDRIHFLDKRCHYDLFQRELRWDDDPTIQFKDGLPVSTIGFNESQLGILKAIERPAVIDFINKIEGGKAFEKMTFDSLYSASAIGIVTINAKNEHPYLAGGNSFQRLWLEADAQNLSIQPYMAPIFLIPRILSGDVAGFSQRNIKELIHISEELNRLFNIGTDEQAVFLFKLFYTDQKMSKAPRLDLAETLIQL